VGVAKTHTLNEKGYGCKWTCAAGHVLFV
jgi:hypothetical protein